MDHAGRGDRLQRVLSVMAAMTDTSGSVDLCAVSVQVIGTTGAGIMLMSGDIPAGSACCSDKVSARIEELQFTLGEGPCVDAYNDARPAIEPDLRHPATRRWPAFSPEAVSAGALAVFGFPMQIGAVRVGALNLYRTAPGALGDAQHADALVMAGVAARALLAMQAGAPPGELAATLASRADFRAVVHQAAGMIAEQLDITVAEAVIRLRAYAFANDTHISDTAQDVVARRLRLDATQ